MKSIHLPPQADQHKLVFRTLGKDSTSGLLGAGFMRKTGSADSDFHTRFPHFGVVWVLRGTGEFTDSRGQTYPLRPGTVFLRVPGELHSSTVLPDGHWLECFLAFGTPYFRGLDALGRIPQNQRVFPVPLNPRKIQEWVHLCTRLEKASPDEFNDLLLECTAMVLSLLPSSGTSSSPPLRTPTMDDLVDLAARFIEQNPRISPQEIARKLGVSYSHLRSLFTSKRGTTMVAYRKAVTIQKSKLLLIYSTDSLRTIALNLGYSDQAYFSRDFKDLTGLTPRNFRMTAPEFQGTHVE